jgi:glutamate N-acetyltransferase/amino-acid N-acetyltransferase
MKCPGFRFGAVRAGIKQSGALDVGVIAADQPASCAAIFTSNQVKAAPVVVSQKALARSRGLAQAVVVNSGNANACTGPGGELDARDMIATAATALGVRRGHVMVASTGVIGKRLPMERVRAGIAAAAGELGADQAPFAQAILTTDRAAKTARGRVLLGDPRATLMGCTMGAGMFAPNLATTLTLVTTDAAIAPAALEAALRSAASETFNAITVDGDTSTNDMILVMASGAAGNKPVRGATAAAFERALAGVLDELARALMRGGEGVHHVATVRVTSARNREDARRVARTIANSPLVKTAISGQDPNWGRLLCAAGNAGVKLDPRRLSLWLDRVRVVVDGAEARGKNLEQRAAAVMARPEYTITVDLAAGRAEAQYLACDLSHEYVSINADYRS